MSNRKRRVVLVVGAALLLATGFSVASVGMVSAAGITFDGNAQQVGNVPPGPPSDTPGLGPPDGVPPGPPDFVQDMLNTLHGLIPGHGP